jgi:hypothetical protein
VLAAHTQEAAVNGVSAAAAAAVSPGQPPGGGVAGLPSSAALSSSDATGHRSSKGISVTKKLWDVKASKVRRGGCAWGAVICMWMRLIIVSLLLTQTYQVPVRNTCSAIDCSMHVFI